MVIESYVVVHNIAKRHNVGTLARSATAFGVTELILVGRRDFNAFGSHGSTSHLRFRHFHSLLDARNFLKEKDCDICGVEIADGALPVNEHPFKKSTAFLLGNEGTGLSAKECFSERIREGNKFIVAERPMKQVKYCTETEDSIIEERKSRKEYASNGFFDETRNGDSTSNLLDALFRAHNSLTGSDYSPEGWMDIVKYNEDLGKPRLKLK
ncbi:hypothetical protein GH714_002654 [Hevea brasiliensis]|uniref:tRNA/rRNA methyltransferase SpoU type domain-containing protein n=1 Tax=Hevea brasiliensis TaxID=3981 RepID=A0A6A6KFT2_HEVBR|nr:hypothetical protein GH714_002654 [Hevea brasiliensis]